MTIELTTDEHLLVSEALKSYLRDFHFWINKNQNRTIFQDEDTI